MKIVLVALLASFFSVVITAQLPVEVAWMIDEYLSYKDSIHMKSTNKRNFDVFGYHYGNVELSDVSNAIKYCKHNVLMEFYTRFPRKALSGTLPKMLFEYGCLETVKAISPIIDTRLSSVYIRAAFEKGYYRLGEYFSNYTGNSITPVQLTEAFTSAAQNGLEEDIVPLIMNRDQLSPSIYKFGSRLAFEKGHAKVIEKFILYDKLYIPELEDLSYSISLGHTQMAKLVLDNNRLYNEFVGKYQSFSHIFTPALERRNLLFPKAPQFREKSRLQLVQMIMTDKRATTVDINDMFVLACSNGLLEVVKLMIKDYRVNPKDKRIRQTALNGHASVLKILFQDGRATEMFRSENTLFQVAKSDHTDVLRVLLEEKLFVLSSLLVEASKRGHLGLIKAILSENGLSPFVVYAASKNACSKYYRVTQRLLIDYCERQGLPLGQIRDLK
jgi:hypothetical protein